MRRNLTVSTLRRSWSSMHRTQYADVPAIRINGNWLADAGFAPGQKVSVAVKQTGFPSKPALIIQSEGSVQL